MTKNKLSGKQVTLMAVASGIAVANIYYNQPILKDIQQSSQATESEAGIVSLLAQAGYGLGLFFLTPLGDKVRRKKLTIFLFICLSFALLAMGIFNNIFILWICSLAIGIFSVAAQVILPLAASLDRESTGKTVGRIFSGILIGVLAARVLSGLLAGFFGWHSVYLLALVMVIVVSLLLRKYLPDARTSFSNNYLQLLRSTLFQFKRFSTLRVSCILGGLMFGVFCSFWTTITFHLSAAPFNYSPEQIGMFGLVAIGGALAAPVFGKSADKGKARRSLFIAMLLVLASVLAIHFFMDSLAVIIAGIFLLDVGVQAVQVTNVARIYSLDASSNSRINTIYMTCYFIGGALGTALGLLSWHYGKWPLATWQMAGFVSLAMTILWSNGEKNKPTVLPRVNE